MKTPSPGEASIGFLPAVRTVESMNFVVDWKLTRAIGNEYKLRDQMREVL